MKKFNKSSIITALIISCALGFMGPIAALAQTTPSLGLASTFAILGSTYTNTAAGSTINGDIGYTTGPAVVPTVNGTTYVADGTYNQAGIDSGTALTNLNNQACTFTFAPGAIDLATDATHGPIGVYTPGVYCTSGAASIGTGGITLSGNGTYIFRVNGALTTVANSVVTLAGGASACNVFWTSTAATTLGANSTFVGTNIDTSGITIGSTVTQTGRSLAFGGTVTTNGDTMTVPTCAVSSLPPPPPVLTCTLSVNPTTVQIGSSSVLSWITTNANVFSINQGVGEISLASGSTSVTPLVTTTYTGTATHTGAASITCNATVTVTTPPAPVLATLHVIKQVMNNGGGTAIASNFILHVENSGADVSGSPAAGTVAPGTSYSLSAGTYVVSENVSTSYMQSFSGACNSSGSVTLFANDNKTCTITNAYIPPVLTPTSTPSSTFTPVLIFPNTGFPPEGDSPSWNIVTVVSNILRWLRFPLF
jgi:hypothetical protein